KVPPSPAWLAVTPEGFYDCAEGADRVVKWRFPGNQLRPFYDYQEAYLRHDQVERGMSRERITETPLFFTRVSPACRFISPRADAKVTSPVVHLEVLATDDKAIPRIEIFVNG